MRIVTWAIRLVVFLLLAAFAAKNVEPVALRFYFDMALSAPLIVVLLGFFAAGALFGVLALLGALLRQRREIWSLKRQAAGAQSAPPPPL
jgi:lipopolysaccharide assembly protein A